jgi:hypothetical protein
MRGRRLKNLLLVVACAALAWSFVLFVQQDATRHFGLKFGAAIAVVILAVWPSIVPDARQYIYLVLAWVCATCAVAMLSEVRRGLYWLGMSGAFSAGFVVFSLLTRHPLAVAGGVLLFVGLRLVISGLLLLPH